MSFLRRGAPRSAAPLPYAPTSTEGLAARWVQWVASAPFDADPIEDETGEHAGARQPEDVWFLAGSYGTRVHRRCMLPPGRPLFLPLVNLWSAAAADPAEPVPGAYGSLTVDGRPVEAVEALTRTPFEVVGRRLNPVTRGTRPRPVTVWGLWAEVPGLEPGEHELRAVGGLPGGFTVDVTYGLVATPAAAWQPW